MIGIGSVDRRERNFARTREPRRDRSRGGGRRARGDAPARGAQRDVASGVVRADVVSEARERENRRDGDHASRHGVSRATISLIRGRSRRPTTGSSEARAAGRSEKPSAAPSPTLHTARPRRRTHAVEPSSVSSWRASTERRPSSGSSSSRCSCRPRPARTRRARSKGASARGTRARSRSTRRVAVPIRPPRARLLPPSLPRVTLPVRRSFPRAARSRRVLETNDALARRVAPPLPRAR